MDHQTNPDILSVNHGISPIGAAQRTVAFTAVADAGNGLVNITAAGHGLKKGQCVYIAAGDYAGIRRIKKIISANVIQVEATFTATAAGDLLLTAHLEGFGFYCDEVPLTIAEIEPDNPNDDAAAFIATTFIAGEYYSFPFKKIRVTAGNITVVRQPVRTDLSYTRR